MPDIGMVWQIMVMTTWFDKHGSMEHCGPRLADHPTCMDACCLIQL
jgi:hypothetical protein